MAQIKPFRNPISASNSDCAWLALTLRQFLASIQTPVSNLSAVVSCSAQTHATPSGLYVSYLGISFYRVLYLLGSPHRFTIPASNKFTIFPASSSHYSPRPRAMTRTLRSPPCILVEGTYYLATSSFLYTPGIPIYTSQDLIHWTQIGNVITRPSQLSLAQCTIRPGTKNCGGVWAPTIRFHNGTFYVCATCVFPDRDFADHSRWENIIWRTTDPHAQDAWSDGVRFSFPGYDTSLFWDDDDRVYIQGSTYWRVQEGISQLELDLDTGESRSGTGRRIPEAPHMYRKDGWYYLLIAEGGTELEHCATIARSKSVWGPFEPNPNNPIIHAAHKDAYFQTIGHADIFQSVSGHWFAVALATRDGRVNFPMGRETVLIPGEWNDDWPVFDAPVESVMCAGSGPEPEPPQRVSEDVLAGFTSTGSALEKGTAWPHGLLRLRNPDEQSYAVVQRGGHPILQLTAPANGDTLNGAFGSPAFVARRQTAIEFTTELELLVPHTAELVAGVSVYLDFESHFDLVLASGPNGIVASIRTGVASECDAPAMITPGDGDSDGGVLSISLRVIAHPDSFAFFARAGGEWVAVGRGAARDVSAGFTGVVVGPFVEAGRVEVQTWVYFEP
ncbi:hypothetical protein FRC10_008626 [Ceratobasidium sp. 414]|nr:hypothetical protein FRC10_008626 [Ceratobasidium sp. 414]